uniref:Retrovirus-related Pol polyprotein from transposon TNT 1-94 n=1 Tax=Tanacetum cinerariifolium TaxID=118510 RepID=A0A6L2KHH5_TANCI|nr:retrovirus-related Pol polyprotein from transposon TNT 1-94 [Tanacetum cinerariifolium]
MRGTKFDIKKFNGKNDYGLSQVRMKDLLQQHGLPVALEELPEATIVAYDNVIWKKAYNALILCLGDRKKLYTFNMHPGKSQSEHIDEFHKLVGDLATIDTAISDEDQALLLPTSLPSYYVNFVDTLLFGQDTLKLEDVLATLNSKELQKMTEAKGDSGEGLYVRGRSGQRNIKQGKGFVRYEDQVSSSEADGYDNGMPYMGTGKVRVQIRDGSSFVLDNVRFVVELRRNLISLGTLVKEGFTVKMQSGKIKVIKGSMVRSTQQCMKSGVTNHLGVARIQQQNEDTTKSTYRVYRSPSSTIGFKTHIDMLGFFGWLANIKQWMLEMRNMGFNENEEYKKTFIGSGVAEKINAHESLTCNDTIACEVISKWNAGFKEDIDARSVVYVLSNDYRKSVTTTKAITGSIHQDIKGLLDEAEDNILRMEIVRDQSGNTLRVSQFRVYNGVYTRPDIASADVGMLDGLDHGLQINVHVFVDFDYAMGRSINVMGRSIAINGMIIRLSHSIKQNQWHSAMAIKKSVDDAAFEYFYLTSTATETKVYQVLRSEFIHLGRFFVTAVISCHRRRRISPRKPSDAVELLVLPKKTDVATLYIVVSCIHIEEEEMAKNNEKNVDGNFQLHTPPNRASHPNQFYERVRHYDGHECELKVFLRPIQCIHLGCGWFWKSAFRLFSQEHACPCITGWEFMLLLQGSLKKAYKAMLNGREVFHVTTVKADTLKLIVQIPTTPKLSSPFPDEHSSLTLEETSIEGKPIQMMGVPQEEVERVILKMLTFSALTD